MVRPLLAEEVIENPSEMSGEPAQLPEPQSSEATATQAAPADPNAKPACEPEKKKKPPVNPCTTSHKDPFYNNDFSYLLDPEYTGQCFGDCWKLMPVDECGEYGTLDVGGQMRLRYHHEIGMGQDRSGVGTRRFENTEHDFLLSRLRLYGNWKCDDRTRVFVEGILADVTTDDGTYMPRIIDRNFGDFLNGFIDYALDDSLTVRMGRQELLYGAQRLVSPLDWANTPDV